MKSFFAFGVIILCTFFSFQAQTIQGVVVDEYSKHPLSGVSIYCDDSTNSVITNGKGEYTFDSLSLSKHKLIFLLNNYEDVVIGNVDVTVGKTKYIDVEMRLSILKKDMNEIRIVASKKPNNAYASVSVSSFDPSLATKFAGGLGDPSRLTYNFPNVIGFDDSRNDIIIRSNSPSSVLWRIEGINVPTPNHFAQAGATGGAVTILNTDYLRKTDFYTGGFPSEFGNVVGGVFDLKLRNGNKNKFKFTAKNSWNGLEAGIEGPTSKKSGGSFWVNYRYSFLNFMYQIGIPIDFHPDYQDISFYVSQPVSKKVKLGLFGIGGLSSITLKNNLTDNNVNTINVGGSDLSTEAKIGIAGLTAKILMNTSTTLDLTLGVSASTSNTNLKDPEEWRNNPLSDFFDFHGSTDEDRILFGAHLNKKINSKNAFKAGVLIDKYISKIFDSIHLRNTYDNRPTYEINQAVINSTLSDNAYLTQLYIDYQYRWNDNLSFQGGLNYSHFFWNNSFAINPRLGSVYEFNNGMKLSFSYSHHSQLPPIFVYIVTNPISPVPQGDFNVNYTQDFNTLNKDVNKNLGFTKAHHLILSYETHFLQSFKLKSELYYQDFYEVPVHRDPSFFSMLNFGGEYRLDRPVNLVNSGTGYNYGIDITIEKVVKDGYYFLVNGSLSDSRYRGSDDVLRRTKFANIYLANAVGGYSLKLWKGTTMDMNLRCVYSGGRRVRAVDLEKSKEIAAVYYDDANSYESKIKDYFRLDFKLSLQHNMKKSYFEYGIELINLTNNKNVLNEFYDVNNNKVDYTYQSSFIAIPFFRMYF